MHLGLCASSDGLFYHSAVGEALEMANAQKPETRSRKKKKNVTHKQPLPGKSTSIGTFDRSPTMSVF